MRIGIEAQRLFREKKHGLEIVALELIRNLQRIDTENEYVVFVRTDKDNTCIKETHNFKIREIAASSFPEWEQIKLPRAVKAEKIDLLHCTANTSPLFSSVPMVLTLHDIIFMEGVKIGGNNYQNIGNLYRRLILPRVLKKNKKILTVSEFEKKHIVDFLKLDPSRVEVIYNAVDSSFKKIESDDSKLQEIRSRYNLPKKFILFFGNSAKKKNTVETVKAYIEYAEQNKDSALDLVISGGFPDYVKRELTKLEIPAAIRSKIVVTEHIPFHEQPIIYNLAHLFLYTSLRESFGMPILESMGCGTPVITSSTSSMPEIAGDAAILVDPFDKSSIAKGISAALSDTTRYAELVQLGHKRASQFNWETTARKVLNVYKEVLSM